VAHACNPSYSGSRDQEDHGSKPAWTRPYLEKTLHKNKTGGVAQGEGPEFKPSTRERERERETDILTVNTFISFVRKRRRYGRQKLCVHHVCLRLGIWLLVILIS
jgi:hypothetical protein